jgi:hypothetical protein
MFLTVLLLSFIIVGLLALDYGLPLFVVDDEQSVVLGAMKMLELRTVIPSLHQDQFSNILYYPPYFSYLLLPAFATVVAWQFFTGPFSFYDLSSFKFFLGLDLSPFFIFARLFSLVAAVFCIIFVVDSSRKLFESRSAGLFAGIVIASSLNYMAVSFVARHWIFVTLCLSCVIWLLVNRDIPINRRYFLSLLVSAVGSGFSPVCLFGFVISGLWFLVYEGKIGGFSVLVGERPIRGILLLLFFIFLPLILNLHSNGFTQDVSVASAKNLLDLLKSPAVFLSMFWQADFSLITLAIAGCVFGLVRRQKWALIFFVAVILYSFAFYLFFRFENRFFVPMMPILAIYSAFPVKILFEKFGHVSTAVFLLLMVLPIMSSVKLASLLFLGDARSQSIEWLQNNINHGVKMVSAARSLKINSNRDGVIWQKTLDPLSLRTKERSEYYFNGNLGHAPFFTSVNLDTVKASSEEVYNFVRKFDPEVIVLDEKGRKTFNSVGLLRNYIQTKDWGQFSEEEVFSLSKSQFRGWFVDFWVKEYLGPRILIFEKFSA